MKRTLAAVATFLFGIVPASLILISNAVFFASISAGAPEGVTFVTSWVHLALFVVAGAGALVGYVALFFAAKLRMSGRVAVGLLIGAGAAIYEIMSAHHELIILCALVSPAIVALVHAISYFVGWRHHAANPRNAA